MASNDVRRIGGSSSSAARSAARAALPADAGAALAPRQLAAARLVARGRGPGDVAAELGVTRQAVWKWRRAPGFAAEVRWVHEPLVATAAERRVRAPGSR